MFESGYTSARRLFYLFIFWLKFDKKDLYF